MAAGKEHRLVVGLGGARLDRYVVEQCPQFTRSYVQKLIEAGDIRVNDRPARAGLKLTAGDVVTVAVPPPPPSPLPAESVPLKIIYEDADILVVDKPAGLTTHPAPGHLGGTLVNALLARYPDLAVFGDALRPGIVHRLDRDTSGLVVVARNREAQQHLVEQFRTRSVSKWYMVLARGRLTPERGVIEAPIGRDPANRKRMAVAAGGREARTQYHVVKYLDGYTLLEVKPETGRTHQIRVHLAAIGHPVVGDATYGLRSPLLSRQFLHAARLGFRLPSTGEYVEFESPLPADLEEALEKAAPGQSF